MGLDAFIGAIFLIILIVLFFKVAICLLRVLILLIGIGLICWLLFATMLGPFLSFALLIVLVCWLIDKIF